MKRNRAVFLTSLLALACLAAPVDAQTSDVLVTVTDSLSAAPLGGAEVTLRFAESTAVAVTNRQGEALITGVPQGNWTLLVTRMGFASVEWDDVRIPAGGAARIPVRMSPTAQSLDPLVVSASRSPETAFDAPRAVSVVGREEIEARPVLSPVDRIANLPGVEVISGGMVQRRYTVRGQNFGTSSQLRTIIDSRWSVLPNVDHNLPYVLPVNDEDIDRIELLRGPAAALWGPNTNRGVLQIVTRSPFDSPGTTVSLAGGGRSYLQGMFRHARLLGDAVAIKLSGNWFRGDDWVVTDPGEEEVRNALITAGADPDTLLVGKRDHTFESLGGEARLDWRPDAGGELSVRLGTAVTRSTFDPLTFGGLPVQLTDAWNHSAQVRYERDRLVVNAFVNQAQVDSSVYLTSNGYRLADRSTALVAQLQHGLQLGSGQSFTYGAEVQRTIPRTLDTQHQFTEDFDELTEVGAYLHSETSLWPSFDFVASGRMDYHSVLDDVAFSPSAAFVFKPRPAHAIRVSYATGFATPGTGVLFNDYPLASFGPYDLRAIGLYQDLTFRRDCGGLCMRSPFAPDPSTWLPADGTVLWPVVVALLQAEGIDISPLPAPTAAEVSSVLASLNLTTGSFDPVSASAVTDIGQWRRLTHNTFEVGYKGVLGDRALVTVDVHYNDMGPVLTERSVPTPNVFLDPVSLTTYLSGFMPAANAQGLAEAIAAIPLGTVTPKQANDPTALMMIELEGGDVTYWGADLGITLNLSPRVQAYANYAWTEKDIVPDLAGRADFVFLNPRNRGSFGFDYTDGDAGVTGGVRARLVDGFPAFDGIARADVESYGVVDASLSYRLPWEGMELSVSATNLFDSNHRELPGSPYLGRHLMSRLRVSF